MKNFLYVLMFALVVSGCGDKTDVGAPLVGAPDEAGTSPAPTKTVDPASAGSIKGRALFEGQPPPEPKPLSVKGNPECAKMHPDGHVPDETLLVGESGGLGNVFVYVKKGLEDYSFEPPSQAVTIDNRDCRYVPHVAGVQTGQTVQIANSDDTLHNVHSYAKNQKSWNIGLPVRGMKVVKKFAEPEVMVVLKCDVHPWMLGYVGVVGHPFFSVTDAGGNFDLKGLPPGEYEIEAWHEKLGARSQTVRIEPRSGQNIEFRFS